MQQPSTRLAKSVGVRTSVGNITAEASTLLQGDFRIRICKLALKLSQQGVSIAQHECWEMAMLAMLAMTFVLRKESNFGSSSNQLNPPYQGADISLGEEVPAHFCLSYNNFI